MNYAAMTADEEARIVDSMTEIRRESEALKDTLLELRNYLREICSSERPEIKPDPNSVYILNEMKDIISKVVDVQVINGLVDDNRGYMTYISRDIKADLEEAAKERLKNIRPIENEENEEYI